jgi:glycosyltransferase involved in cell wall biosynthesis
MQHEALVSVLIPVYNVGRYVEQAVNSILTQTYKNIEVIVVDDCSIDDTLIKVQKLAKLDSRVRVIKNDKNLKISKSLNEAYFISNGEYILRMDGDDVSAHDRIAVKLKFLKMNPDIDIVGCSTNTINEDGVFLCHNKMVQDEHVIEQLLPLSTPLKHIWLSKRKVYEALNAYRDISGVEDYDFLLRAKYHGFKFTNISDYYGYDVRIGRDGSTISSLGYKQLKLKKLVYLDYLSSYTGTVNYADVKINKILNGLYSFASKRLSAGISYRAKKEYFWLLLNLAMCLVSPQMVNYLYERGCLRYFYWKNNI